MHDIVAVYFLSELQKYLFLLWLTQFLQQNKKITPDKAYQVVSSTMENNPNSVKTSEIGVVFDKALRKVICS